MGAHCHEPPGLLQWEPRVFPWGDAGAEAVTSSLTQPREAAMSMAEAPDEEDGLCPAKPRSVPSMSACPKKQSPTFGGASPRPGGLTARRPPATPRARGWR